MKVGKLEVFQGYDDDSGVHRKLVIVKALAKVGALKERAVQDCLSLIKGKYDYYGAWGAVVLRDLVPEAKGVLGELKKIAKNAKDEGDLKRSLLKTIEVLEEK